MPRRAAHLPDAGVRLPPAVLEPLQQHARQRPARCRRGRPRARASGTRRPAPRRRRRAAAASRPRCRPAPASTPRSRAATRARARPAAARRAMPYMICRSAGSPATARSSQLRHARASSTVAGVQHRHQRQRRVAQPAEAVIPVAQSADVLGQRGGRGRHDAARGRVRERLQHQQRLVDLVVVVAAVTALVGPLEPVRLGVGERLLRVDRPGSGLCDGNQVSTNGIRSPASRVNSETLVRSSPRTVDRRAEAQRVRAGDGDACALHPPHPRARCRRSRTGSRAPTASAPRRRGPRRCGRCRAPRHAAA